MEARSRRLVPFGARRTRCWAFGSVGDLAFSRRAGRGVHEEIEAKEGLPSADRNNKATLLLTGPFRTAKSSAKDLIPRVLKLQYAKYHRTASGSMDHSPAKMRGRSLFVSIYNVWEVSPRSGMDSDLEAFSHYPADGSVAALPGRTAAKTNYLNQRFLSY